MTSELSIDEILKETGVSANSSSDNKKKKTDADLDPESEILKQKLACVISEGKSEEYFEKIITLDDLDKMSAKKIRNSYEIYEAKFLSKINTGLANTVITGGVNALGSVLVFKDTPGVINELKQDPLLMRELGRGLGMLYFKYQEFLALLSGSIIIATNIDYSATKDRVKNWKTTESSSEEVTDRVVQN